MACRINAPPRNNIKNEDTSAKRFTTCHFSSRFIELLARTTNIPRPTIVTALPIEKAPTKPKPKGILSAETAARRMTKAVGQGISPVKNPVKNSPFNGDISPEEFVNP